MKPYKASLTQQADALAYDLRQRINPAYATQRGTESYERREGAEMIEALVQRVQELEADRDQYRMMWLREKEANDLRGGNGKAEQPGVATAPSEVYEAELPHPIDAAFVRWAHNHIDTKLYEGMKGPTDIEGHPV